MDKQDIKQYYNAFQIADFDNDLIGMCKSLVDWMKKIRTYIDDEDLEKPDDPENFFKIDPHCPRVDLRENVRKMFGSVYHTNEITDEEVRFINFYVCILSTGYAYHFPIKEMVERSKDSKEFSREEALEMLLKDKMSPNWIKEPSGSDYSKIMY